MTKSSGIPLTLKQNAVLEHLRNHFVHSQTSPSLKEIAATFDVSLPTAQFYVESLINKGYISKIRNAQRSIQLKEAKTENLTVSKPILGRVSAGMGIDLFEETDPPMIEVPVSMVPISGSSYCLEVEGFSMVEDGIYDGDIIVVKQQKWANPGDTVIAIIKKDFGELVTLKRFNPKEDVIELLPRNPSYKKIVVPRENLEIRGVFCGLMRTS